MLGGWSNRRPRAPDLGGTYGGHLYDRDLQARKHYVMPWHHGF
jgi:hypothetical protein